MENAVQTYQFNAPMTGYLFNTQPLSYKEKEIHGEELVPYKELIDEQIEKSLTTSTEKETGLAQYLPEGLKEKVLSVFPSTEIERRFGREELESVMTVTTTSSLCPEETNRLLDFLERQYNSGWSSSISNREIETPDGSFLHVSFAVPSTDYFAVTQSPELESDYEYEILSPVTLRFFPESQHTNDYITLAGDEVHLEDEFINTLKALAATRMTPQETLYGLAPYFSFTGAEKILSAQPSLKIVPARFGETLVCATTIKTDRPLDNSEMECLKKELSAQFSDGWGEWLEQQPIQAPEGEYYLHTWSLGDASYQLKDTLIKEPDQNAGTQDYTFEPSF